MQNSVNLMMLGVAWAKWRKSTLGIPLKIAAKVDRTDEVYFRDQITPLLKGPGVQFIGEIDEQQKSDFLGQALALVGQFCWSDRYHSKAVNGLGPRPPSVWVCGRNSGPP
jgi:hypothetical protein